MHCMRWFKSSGRRISFWRGAITLSHVSPSFSLFFARATVDPGRCLHSHLGSSAGTARDISDGTYDTKAKTPASPINKLLITAWDGTETMAGGGPSQTGGDFCGRHDVSLCGFLGAFGQVSHELQISEAGPEV